MEQLTDLGRYLRGCDYPGRGILLGRTGDGGRSVAAYFIMGRSANSRNRVFSKTPDGIRTEAFDPALLADPSLILYHPVRRLGRSLIVTNGDQTDTIRDALERRQSFESALRTRAFEPDAPHWTPRISGLLSPDGSFRLAILRSADAAGTACERSFFEYPGLPGQGRLLHTYLGGGDPLPSFTGEPKAVAIPDTVDELTDLLWDNLHAENKISLYVRYADLATGQEKVRIRNLRREEQLK